MNFVDVDKFSGKRKLEAGSGKLVTYQVWCLRLSKANLLGFLEVEHVSIPGLIEALVFKNESVGEHG